MRRRRFRIGICEVTLDGEPRFFIRFLRIFTASGLKVEELPLTRRPNNQSRTNADEQADQETGSPSTPPRSPS